MKYKTKHKKECIIRYSGLKSYSKPKPVSSINKEAILKAKSIRECICGQTHHQQQQKSTPSPIDKEKQQLHRECCLKLILVNNKNLLETVETKMSSRPSAGGFSKLNGTLLLLLEEEIETQCVFETLKHSKKFAGKIH